MIPNTWSGFGRWLLTQQRHVWRKRGKNLFDAVILLFLITVFPVFALALFLFVRYPKVLFPLAAMATGFIVLRELYSELLVYVIAGASTVAVGITTLVIYRRVQWRRTFGYKLARALRIIDGWDSYYYSEEHANSDLAKALVSLDERVEREVRTAGVSWLTSGSGMR